MNNLSVPSRNAGSDLIYGLHSVLEAIRAGREFEKVYVKKGLTSGTARELLDLLKTSEIPFQWVPREKLDRLTRKNHQGVVALGSLIEYQSLYNLIPGLFEKGREPFIVALDGITDVRNLGAIARTAECAGVDGLLLPVKGSALINADTLKTSSGALSIIPVCRTEDLFRSLRFLQESGLKIVIASEKASGLHYRSDLSGPSVVVIGSEEKGVSSQVFRLSDLQVRIPLFGQVNSLNASTAAAVILYEVRRQRDIENECMDNLQ